MCILFGCDYVKRVPTIGNVKSYDIIRELKGGSYNDKIKALPTCLNKYLKEKSDLSKYMEDFEKALDIFNHHIVYNIFDKIQCRLNEGTSLYWKQEMFFEPLAKQHAQCEIPRRNFSAQSKSVSVQEPIKIQIPMFIDKSEIKYKMLDIFDENIKSNNLEEFIPSILTNNVKLMTLQNTPKEESAKWKEIQNDPDIHIEPFIMGKIMCANDILNLTQFDRNREYVECFCKLKATCVKIEYRSDLDVLSNNDEYLGSSVYVCSKEGEQKCEFSFLQLVEDYDEFLHDEIEEEALNENIEINNDEPSSEDDSENELYDDNERDEYDETWDDEEDDEYDETRDDEQEEDNE